MYKISFLGWLLTLVVTLSPTFSSRILLAPGAHYSHINFFTLAARALQDAGHEVTVLVHEKHGKRVDKDGVPSIQYPLSDSADMSAFAGKMLASAQTASFTDIINSILEFRGTLKNYCHELLGNYKVMTKIEHKKFDFALVDSTPIMACTIVILYKYDIPYIGLGPMLMPWLSGVSTAPTHEPPFMIVMKEKYPSFMQRIVSLPSHIFVEKMTYLMNPDDLVRTYVPEKPDVTMEQLQANAAMYLITQDTTCFDIPRISAPNYRFIGSLSAKADPKPLPDEFRVIADSSIEGLIIISFGSMVSARKSLIRNIDKLLKALGQRKERAILQFTESDLVGFNIPKNVIVKEWLPQMDLLSHNNTKLFISHGGLNGHLESTYAGVPILTLPYQIEHIRNGARAEARRHGKLLHWEETNADELYQTISELLDNAQYHENIQKCSQILSDLPSAKDQLVFWVNHVIKFGSSHLRPIAADMPVHQFFMLDVFLVMIVCAAALTCTCWKFCQFCFRKCRGNILKNKRD